MARSRIIATGTIKFGQDLTAFIWTRMIISQNAKVTNLVKAFCQHDLKAIWNVIDWNEVATYL
jgi:hypothetical protein